MITTLEGTVRARAPSGIVVEVAGVGFGLEVPLSTYERVPAHGTVRLFVRLYIQDDQIRLFGFATDDERRLFEALIQSGTRVGPVKALAILSSASVAEIHGAIARGDAQFLKRIRGVGDKIAQRLVVELKDRIAELAPGGDAAPAASAVDEASRALLALGYGAREAQDAARAAAAELGAAAGVEALLKRSLQTRR